MKMKNSKTKVKNVNKEITGKQSKSYGYYDLQSALKNIRVEEGEKCPFKYNAPKFEKKKDDNKEGKSGKFFNKFKKNNDNEEKSEPATAEE